VHNSNDSDQQLPTSEMTYIVSRSMLNSTHSLTHC